MDCPAQVQICNPAGTGPGRVTSKRLLDERWKFSRASKETWGRGQSGACTRIYRHAALVNQELAIRAYIWHVLHLQQDPLPKKGE